MELELQYTELSCCEAGESVTLTQEETLEAAIPEYCPEVTRIVDAVGQLCLREYTSRQISGSVLVTVLYTSEESPGLRSLTLPVPFLTQADDKRLTGCDNRLHGGPPAADGGQSRHRPKAVPAGHAGADSHRLHLPPPPHLHRRRGGAYPAPAPSGAVPYPADLGDAAAEQRDSGAPASGLGRAAGGTAGPAHLPPHHRQPAGGEPLLAMGEARICLLYRTQDGPSHTGEDTPALFLPFMDGPPPFRPGGWRQVLGHRLMRTTARLIRRATAQPP